MMFRSIKLPYFFIALSIALTMMLPACSAYVELPTRELADEVAVVSDENRDVRACLLVVMVIEAGTDRVRLFDPDQAPEMLGRLMGLEGAINRLKDHNVAWTNTEMADIIMKVSRVLIAGGEDRLAQRILDGLSVGGVLEAARRVAVTGTKEAGMLADIKSMLADLESNTITKDAVWAACDERAKHNAEILAVLAGVQL